MPNSLGRHICTMKLRPKKKVESVRKMSRAPEAGLIKAGRSDVNNLAEFDLPGVVPGCFLGHPLQNRGCRLLCSEMFWGLKNRPREDLRMTGFIVTGLRCGPNWYENSKKRIQRTSRVQSTVGQSVWDQLPSWSPLQLGQVGCHEAVFCLLGKAILTNLDQVGPALFPTEFRAFLRVTRNGSSYFKPLSLLKRISLALL